MVELCAIFDHVVLLVPRCTAVVSTLPVEEGPQHPLDRKKSVKDGLAESVEISTTSHEGCATYVHVGPQDLAPFPSLSPHLRIKAASAHLGPLLMKLVLQKHPMANTAHIPLYNTPNTPALTRAYQQFQITTVGKMITLVPILRWQTVLGKVRMEEMITKKNERDGLAKNVAISITNQEGYAIFAHAALQGLFHINKIPRRQSRDLRPIQICVATIIFLTRPCQCKVVKFIMLPLPRLMAMQIQWVPSTKAVGTAQGVAISISPAEMSAT
mmetsp:Transcript_28519/g.39708  ORF Transcript_28519/g.39708 Transcript_28519/m.39708 type:complete len:270 (+) Transcript_28519:981-1790(+)